MSRRLPEICPARVLEMLNECERLAILVGTLLHGMRGGVPAGSWVDKELKATESIAIDLQLATGRFVAEAKGEVYVVPTHDAERFLPPSQIN